MNTSVIHSGPTFTITSDGVTAVKAGGSGPSRSMAFYPERDVTPLAGEIDELTAWIIMRDVARQAAALATPISPAHILIDGQGFILSPWSASHDVRFTAPEGYSHVWALAASVFYIFLGTHVFQGLGGKGQTPTAPVPTLRRALPELSSLIINCLDYDPSRRPSLEQVAQLADSNAARCQASLDERPPMKSADSNPLSADELDSLWPEDMR